MNVDMNKGFNWDEIKEQLSKAVKLEKNDKNLSIKIAFIGDEAELKENQMVGSMMQGEDQMKMSLGQYMGKNGALDCDIEMSEDPNNRFMVLKLKNKKDFKKTYKLLDDMFFGDFFKKMIEAMMGAFGNMFGGE